jgi:hypothetical protein
LVLLYSVTLPIHWDHPFWVIPMGIEHQPIHIATSLVIIRRLPIEMVRQLPWWSICPKPCREALDRPADTRSTLSGDAADRGGNSVECVS